MQTAKEAREARRKRILERGSDRLAYITGDLSKHHSLKASPTSLPPQDSSPIADTLHADGHRSFESQDAKPEGFELSDHATEITGNFQELVPGSQPSNSDELSAAPLDTMPLLASSSRSLAEPTNRVPVSASTSGDCSQRPLGVKAGKKSSLTLVKNIVYSIEASESLRALTAAIMAAFVVLQMVLSCCSHPLGNALAVLLPRWPIGLVFLTDVTLVMGAYIIYSSSKSFQKSPDATESEGLDARLDKISQALDVMGRFEHLLNIGLLCKKAAGAISLDCSIYVVVIVCGFSLSQYAFSCCKDF